MSAQANADMSSDTMEEVDVYLVSECFVKQYYWILNQRTDLLHQFYGPDSSVVVSESLGGDSQPYVVKATTPEDLCQLLQHLFKQVVVTLTELLPQKTVGGSVMVMVTGRMAQEMWTEERCFTQVFLLARQATGFYIRTDTLQVHNPTETIQMLKGMPDKLSEALVVEEKEDQVEIVDEDEKPEMEKTQGMEVPTYESEEEQDRHLGKVSGIPDVSTPKDVFVEITPPMPISQLVDSEPITEDAAAVQTPRTPNPVQSASDGGNSKEKKSFLEVLLIGANRGKAKPAVDPGNAKAAPTNREALEQNVSEDVPEPPAHRLEPTKALNGANDTESRQQRPRANRQPRTNASRAGTGDGFEGNANGGRGRGRGGQARGRNAPGGRNGGRGRLPRNPSAEVPGDRTSSGSNPDRNEDRQRTIFVGQLPIGADVQTIHSAFSIFGNIAGGPDGITVRTGPKNAFAFVVFEDPSAARKALEGNVKIHGEELAIKPFQPRERSGKDRADLRGRRGGYGGRGGGRSGNSANGGYDGGHQTRSEWNTGRQGDKGSTGR